jgi:glutamyl-tRNA synthetase
VNPAADGRYASSASGTLHLGNLRTALLAWLFARSAGARFLLRFDDIDPDRSRAEHVQTQLRDLAAIGIDWDGRPPRQSERLDHYEHALGRLEAAGLLYPCYCTRADIRAATSAPQGEQPHAYPGTCRDLSRSERLERERAGRPPSLRVRADAAHVAFADRLHGEHATVVDDFVVRRSDGAFAYQLTIVVDDAMDAIGEIVRGADLLDSTPRQIWLAGRLGLHAPRHAHVPLMLGSKGHRLAKRDGAVTLAERTAADGMTPLDVAGWLLRTAGQEAPPGSSPADWVAGFDPGRIGTGPTVLGAALP